MKALRRADGGDRRRRDRALADAASPTACGRGCRRSRSRSSSRRSSASATASASSALREELRRLARPDDQSAGARFRAGARAGPRPLIPRLPPPGRTGRRADLRGDRRAPRAPTDLGERDDILSLLLAARHEDGSPMSDAELRDELLTLLVAGHETTATALAWAVERLVRHPDKLERLRDEVARRRGRVPEGDVQETLRLRPVISLVNRASRSRSRSAATRCRPASRSPPASTSSTAPRRLSGARALPARALPRDAARHLHLDPVRRRRAPLHRRRLRPVRDGGRAARARPQPRDRRRRSARRAGPTGGRSPRRRAATPRSC